MIAICLLYSAGERWLCHADVFEQLLIVFEQMPINLSALSDEQRRLRLKKREVKKTKAEATIRYDDDFTADNYRHLWKWSSRWFATDTGSVSPVLEEEAAGRLTDLYNCVLPSYMSELHVYKLKSSAHLWNWSLTIDHGCHGIKWLSVKCLLKPCVEITVLGRPCQRNVYMNLYVHMYNV